MRTRAAVVTVVCGWLSLWASPAPAQQLAFPGAEGFGASATGGSGGSVYHVTNLDDAGAGSLRDAVRKGPRLVVFDVSGYVDLKSVLHVASDITLAGQTAPAPGVATRYQEVSFSDSHNVIVRYIRFRQGTTGNRHKSAVNMAGGRNIILDHVSIEWGRWDTVDMTGSSDITIQDSIIGPGIAPQRFGCLCESENVTFSHCLFISNHGRNPKAKGKIQFVNNVVYNWQHDAFEEGGHTHAQTWDDLIGNYFISGPDTGEHHAISGASAGAHVYAAGNYLDQNRNGKLDGSPVPEKDLGPVQVLKEPWAKVPVHIDTAEQAYLKVVKEVGCSLHRDSVDSRLIEDLKSLGKSGKLISSQDDMGGWGDLEGGRGGAEKKPGKK